MFHSINSKTGKWSTQGCTLVTTNDSVTVCQCDHLTNFAILMGRLEVSKLALVCGTLTGAHLLLCTQADTDIFIGSRTNKIARVHTRARSLAQTHAQTATHTHHTHTRTGANAETHTDERVNVDVYVRVNVGACLRVGCWQDGGGGVYARVCKRVCVCLTLRHSIHVIVHVVCVRACCNFRSFSVYFVMSAASSG